MTLGKQVGTYLTGRNAEAFEDLRSDRKTTVYKLLAEAVECLLVKEGYIEQPKPKQRIDLSHRDMMPPQQEVPVIRSRRRRRRSSAL